MLIGCMISSVAIEDLDILTILRKYGGHFRCVRWSLWITLYSFWEKLGGTYGL